MTRCARAGPRGRVWAPRQSPASHSRPAIYLSVGKAGEPRRQGPPDREPRALGGGERTCAGWFRPRRRACEHSQLRGRAPASAACVEVTPRRAGALSGRPARSARPAAGPRAERTADGTHPDASPAPPGGGGDGRAGSGAPRATRPASAERAHLAVTPCSLGGSGEARGGCGGPPRGLHAAVPETRSPAGVGGLANPGGEGAGAGVWTVRPQRRNRPLEFH